MGEKELEEVIKMFKEKKGKKIVIESPKVFNYDAWWYGLNKKPMKFEIVFEVVDGKIKSSFRASIKK